MPQNAALRADLRRILHGGSRLRDGDPRLSEDDRIRSYLTDYLSFLDRFEQVAENPSQFVSGADTLLEEVLLGIEQLDEAIEAEENDGKKALLGRIRGSLVAIRDEMQSLISTRDIYLPDFAEKSRLEGRRQEIYSILSSDSFDRERFELLRSRFPDLLSRPSLGERTLDWAGSVFSGQSHDVSGPEGYTDRTIEQVLNAYFAENPDGSFSLSNLLPEPGEDSASLTAKIALSQFVSSIPREQFLNLPSILPVMTLGWGHMTGGIFSVVRDVPAFASGVADFGDVEIGPENFQEMMEDTNSPLWRNYYSFLSYLGGASDQHPQANMSSQVYMLLAQSQRETVRQVLYQHLASADWRNADTLPMNQVDRRTMGAFLEYVGEDLFPRLHSARMQQRINYLYQTGRIPLNYEQLMAYASEESRQALLNSLPEGNFELFDSAHDSEHREAAVLLETVLRVVGELNNVRAVDNIDLYSMTYFDPISDYQSAVLQYQASDNVDIPRRIPVIHYSENPDVGEVRVANTPIFGALEQLGVDGVDWLDLYGAEALDGLATEFLDDPLDFGWDAAVGSGGFAVNFGMFMGRQIEMGYTNIWRGSGELLSALMDLQSGDPSARTRAINALQRAAQGIADTTGAFTVYEVIPWIFYADVLSEIENGNYAAAFGKFIAITAMTLRSFRTTYDVVRTLATRGLATIEWTGLDSSRGRFRITINDRETAQALYEERMAQYEEMYSRHIQGRTGLRLLTYHFNPFALGHDIITGAQARYARIRGAASYMSGGMEVSIADSPVQIRLESEGPSANNTWTSVAEVRTDVGLFITRGMRSIRHLGGVPRLIVDQFASGTSGNFRLSPEAAATASDIFTAAELNPEATFRVGNVEVTGAQLTEALSAEGISPETPIEYEGRTISVGELMVYDMTESTLIRIWENPATDFTLRIGRGAQASELTINGQLYRQLVEARAAGDLGRFRQLIEAHGQQTGQPFSGGSIEQLYDAFETPAQVYTLRTDTLAMITPEGVTPFNLTSFVEDLAAGRRLADRLTIETAAGAQTITGRQYLEIVYNIIESNAYDPRLGAAQNYERIRASLLRSGRAIISPEVDAQVFALSQQRMPTPELVGLMNRAGSSLLWGQVRGVFRYRYADESFFNNELNPGQARRLYQGFLRLFGQSRLPAPLYRSWRDVFNQLENSSLVRRYASLHEGMSVAKARIRLAQRIYQQYVTGRTQRMMELLREVATRPDGPLTPEERARFETQGALERGILRGSRVYQRVLAAERGTFVDGLTEFNSSFNLEDQVETVFEAEHLAVEPTGTEVEPLRFAEDVPVELQRELRSELLERNVRLFNQGSEPLTRAQVERALSGLRSLPESPVSRVMVLTEAEGGFIRTNILNLPEGTSVQKTPEGRFRIYDTTTGQTVLSYRVENSALVEAAGEAPTAVEMAHDGVAQANIDRISSLRETLRVEISEVTAEAQARADFVDAAREIARATGVNPNEINSPEDIERLMTDGYTALGQGIEPEEFLRRLSTPEGAAFLRTENGARFSQWLTSEQGRAAIAEGPASFVTGLVMIAGVEGLIHIIPGLNDWFEDHPGARFAVVMGSAHQGGAMANPLVRSMLSSAGRADIAVHLRAIRQLASGNTALFRGFLELRYGTQSTAALIGRGARATWGPAAMGSLFRGLGHMWVAGKAWDASMEAFGADQDSIFRHQYVNFAASMGLPIAASGGISSLVSFLEARGLVGAAGAVGGAATIAGAVLAGIGIGLGGIELIYSFATGSYQASVHTRLTERLLEGDTLNWFDALRAHVYSDNAVGCRLLNAALALFRPTDYPTMERIITSIPLVGGSLWYGLLNGGTADVGGSVWADQILSAAEGVIYDDMEQSGQMDEFCRQYFQSLVQPGDTPETFAARIQELLGQEVELTSQEESAYEFIRQVMQNNGQFESSETGETIQVGELGLQDPALLTELQQRFFSDSGSAAVEAFIEKVQLKMVQDQIKSMHMIDLEEFDEDTLDTIANHRVGTLDDSSWEEWRTRFHAERQRLLSLNDHIRAMFDEDGVINGTAMDDFMGWVFGGEEGTFEQSLEAAQTRRVAELLTQQQQITDMVLLVIQERSGATVTIPAGFQQLHDEVSAAYDQRITSEHPTDDALRALVGSLLETTEADAEYLNDDCTVNINHPIAQELLQQAEESRQAETVSHFGELSAEEQRVVLAGLRLEYMLSDRSEETASALSQLGDDLSWLNDEAYMNEMNDIVALINNSELTGNQLDALKLASTYRLLATEGGNAEA
ncbi:MAG: hypothetical protein PHH60_00550 [Candidatus Margulisbacteria bacterium]|nr:hypothetical protein [Candidatus Margulisiibacteriota bacterium]